VRAFVFVFASCVLGACSLLVDSGELTGPTEALEEGGTDAGLEDAFAAPFCARQAPGFLLCADFDDGAVERGWSAVERGNADVTLIGDLVRSPPFAARMTHRARDASVDGALGLVFNTATTAAGIRIELDARAESAIGVVRQEFLAVEQDRGLGAAVECAVGPAEAACTDPDRSPVALTLPPTLDTWHHWDVRVTFTRGSVPGKLLVLRDGAVSVEVPSPSNLGSKGMEISIGPRHIESTEDWDVIVDNVLITIIP
jgi:hypothetical protein